MPPSSGRAGWCCGWVAGGHRTRRCLPDDGSFPAGRVLLALAAAVGPAVFAISATAPLVQRWFAGTGRNPYPLYAASNAGSLLGLLGYPLVVEPALAVADQRWGWAVGFVAVAALVVVAGVVSREAEALRSRARAQDGSDGQRPG